MLYPVTGKASVAGAYGGAGAGICNDPFYPDVIRDAVDDYVEPLELLAQSLRFVDPLTGRSTLFESRIQVWTGKAKPAQGGFCFKTRERYYSSLTARIIPAMRVFTVQLLELGRSPSRHQYFGASTNGFRDRRSG